ncbi:DUF5058 family protein [Liberiplasma polymorphum]|uniref:DUF5058 family protein n=1 Tax=Liberiplasma polymorphum TaxID=3374570 RepID=UPI003774E8A8
MFNPEASWLFVLGFIVVIFVISQSIFFLNKASIRAKELGFTKEDIKKTVIQAMVFSVAPSVAILLGLLLLSKTLGVVVPWIRLSVLGAVTYEMPATINVVTQVFSSNMSLRITDPQMFVTVVWVMTFGVLPPMIIIPLFLKKIQARVRLMREKDKAWGELFMQAMFIGMISAFLGYVIAPRTIEETGETYISYLAILTFLSAAIIISIIGIIINKYKQTWLRNYAIPISMIGAMILAIVYASMGVIR